MFSGFAHEGEKVTVLSTTFLLPKPYSIPPLFTCNVLSNGRGQNETFIFWDSDLSLFLAMEKNKT